MSIKITVSSFSKGAELYNGMLEHAEVIADAEMNADEGDCWKGYAVVHLRAVETARVSVSGDLEPRVQIDRIELMQGANETVAAKMLEEVFEGRTHGGTLLDPDMVSDTADGIGNTVRYGPGTYGPPRDQHQARLRSAVERREEGQ
jgi:hypothetical protein